ncbi:replication-relaxation family protein [Streptomyces sp. NBC_01361]|uniref:replication-relaxation family protein n=1 Tax=Streptomyces sp. NBC_01361 TaxID=2903838 RepID=UPI002E37CE44|nr:replication-relaxation family protein [Streptomyces sp. NBC_01361]
MGSARADAAVVAPEHGVPLLFLEADNCHEDAATIAAKFDKYMRFYQRTVKDTDGRERPMWRTRWSAPHAQRNVSPAMPPVLLVFHQIGARPARTQMQKVARLTREHWQSRWDSDDAFHTYEQKIPIVATTLELLRTRGPHGKIFWRFNRRHLETLWDRSATPAWMLPWNAGANSNRPGTKPTRLNRNPRRAAGCGTRGAAPGVHGVRGEVPRRPLGGRAVLSPAQQRVAAAPV